MSAIEIRNLTKHYGDIVGVEDISLTAEAGEIYGFIGQNGAGKSTTIRVLLNLIFPTSGEAKILGYDCVKDTKIIKGLISYVPSEVSYYPSMKVGDLLRYSAELNGVKDKEKTDRLCAYFELDRNRLIRELSLGNRKKVSVIQALTGDPKVIILDEPTSGLDPVMQDKLFKLLIEEKEKGACVFLSSHNLAEVEKYCDKVCIIRKGRIVKIDTIANMNVGRKLRVTYKTADGKEVSSLHEEDINEIVKNLSKIKLMELEIRRTSLEEDFVKHYAEE